MGGVCYILSRDWHIWRLTFSIAIQAHILTDKKPKGTLTINDLELTAYITHLHISAPHMAPLEHITTGVDNTSTGPGPNVAVLAPPPPLAPSSAKPHGSSGNPRFTRPLRAYPESKTSKQMQLQD